MLIIERFSKVVLDILHPISAKTKAICQHLNRARAEALSRSTRTISEEEAVGIGEAVEAVEEGEGEAVESRQLQEVQVVLLGLQRMDVWSIHCRDTVRAWL